MMTLGRIEARVVSTSTMRSFRLARIWDIVDDDAFLLVRVCPSNDRRA
jgi:hypothetical protein